MHASERQVSRLRLAFLRAALNQEIGAFDTDLTSGKIISGISSHMSIIQDAIGEKVCCLNSTQSYAATMQSTQASFQIKITAKRFEKTNKLFRWQLGHFLSNIATCFSGILIAAICCWEVSLLTLLVVPLVLVTGATYSKKMNAISAAKMHFLSEATSMIEQVTSWKFYLISYHPLVIVSLVVINKTWKETSKKRTQK